MTEQDSKELLQNLNVKLTQMSGNRVNGIDEIFGWNEITAICEAIKALEDVQKYREIVKQGSVSDDVCEWKKHRIIDDVQMYDSSCLHEFEEICAKNYKYCPYCGKKIKVVE